MEACTIAATLILSGCAAQAIIPETIKIPIPTPCIAAADLPKPPEVRSDAEVLAMQDYRAVLAIWRDRIVMRDALAERDALLQGCAR